MEIQADWFTRLNTLTVQCVSPELFAAANRCFGPFTLDLASTAVEAQCPEFITPERDTFTCDWSAEIGNGVGWLNPPSTEDLTPWTAKLATCTQAKVIAVLPASLDADWYWRDIQPYANVYIITPRLAHDGLPIPTMLAAFNSHLYSPRIRRFNWQLAAVEC